MYKELSQMVDNFIAKIKDVNKLSRRQKREVKRKMLRKEYIKRGIRHFGNFSPRKPWK